MTELDQLEIDGAPIDEARMHAYRLGRLQAELRAAGIDAMLTCDPVNTRYATGIRNMQVWAFHSLIRMGLVPAAGRATVFEYAGSEHLADGLDTIDRVVPAIPLHFGPGYSRAQNQDRLRRWADAVRDAALAACGRIGRLAIDNQVPHIAGVALIDRGFELVQAYPLLARAMAVKNADEIRAMRRSIEVAEIGIQRLQRALRPGISENALWAELNHANIEHGGEYMDTRLLSSGPRTNPWYQECSARIVEAGDMIALDTDMIGPFGYDADISRSFVCEPETANARQKTIYRIAHDHIQHNLDLLVPGAGFRELSERAFEVPEPYRAQSIAMNWHGVGLYGGWPTILGRGCFDDSSEDGEIVPGMTLCVEAYVGEVGGPDGVKLEEQVLITERGYRLLSHYPFEESLL